MDSSTTALSTQSAEPPLILTIDIGSSSTRVLLYDCWGRAVAGIAAHERYQMRTTNDGAAEDHRLIASGGALLSSPAWMGVIPSIEGMQAADGEAYEPDNARHGIYQAAMACQRWLYDRLIA